MFREEQYRLIDFGNGQKLESFSGTIVQRQSPSVEAFSPTTIISSWKPSGTWSVENSLTSDDGQPWQGRAPENWLIEHNQSKFILKFAPSGQVGIFPEQATNWDWIDSLSSSLRGLRAINLFGYTGGTTMALAHCDAEVTHVDAARSAVNWARENAKLSGLESAPIRWIAEDAIRFLKREIKRGNSYDIFVADPPSFGRGPKGEVWKLERDLEELLRLGKQLCGGNPKLFLLSCHTPGFNNNRIADIAQRVFECEKVDKVSLALKSESGKKLPSGSCIRWASVGQ